MSTVSAVLNSSNGSILNSNNSTTTCAIMCFNIGNQHCLSFNYHHMNGECQLNADSPYTKPSAVKEAADWAIYYLQKEDDWELVFRAHAYSNLSPYNVWMGTSLPLLPAEDECRLLTSTQCTTIYRNEVLDTWDSENITEVQLELYEDGNRVVYLRFDGVKSTKDNWFDANRLIDSSWSMMSINSEFNHFSILGMCQRTFYINKDFGGCVNDLGWMIIMDPLMSLCSCGYDNNHPGKPAFLYARGQTVTRWEHNEKANVDGGYRQMIDDDKQMVDDKTSKL
ncbi:uncharacterized protein [Argopecten irradians]|uniref:uncharacterized protein n=1 Tax=Argopecten irradians TaxID=31199 RepID=UPI00371F66F6